MESNLVAEFISETGASTEEAYNYLQAKGWDLKLAIHDYLLSKDDCMSDYQSTSSRNDNTMSTDSNCKKLSRGISRATDNINLINQARSKMGLDLKENGVCNINQYFIETPVFTFTLPDLSIFPDDFREFLEKDLIEVSSLLSLEQAGRLNWWADNGLCQRLWPLATTGDGNCLLHAASLGMWGFHDRLLTLRRALHDFLSCSTYKDALWRRWRWQLTRLNAEAGLVYTEEEWHKEWDSVVSMASSTPRNSSRRRSAMIDKPASNREISESATYESLEEIHVLALSHVLKRPIIVIADTILKDVHGEALAPILFGGIYLPLEISPSECHKSPLVLTFDAAHFSALVVMDKETFADKSPHPPAVIPLTDSHHKLLPVQFSVDPGEHFVWGRNENLLQITEKVPLNTKELHFLLRRYLDIVYLPLSLSPMSDEVEFDLELETPYDEEDIEKRFIEANEYDLEYNMPEMSESSLFGSNKSRAAKQMKSVAKQFGSIGKSMSKKLKKNLETITKITKSSSQKKEAMLQSRLANEELTKTQDYMFCARLHTEARHEYQEEMIKNYLTNARDRFEREKRLKQKFSDEDQNFDDEKLKEQARIEGPKNCITQGCNMYGTVLTSYLCTNCYSKQCQEELNTNINSPSLPRAIIIPKKKTQPNSGLSKTDSSGCGMGRSTFYFEASPKSYESAKNFSMASGKSLKPPDETIYLCNSTFYNDRPCGRSDPKDWKGTRGDSHIRVPFSFGNKCQERPKTWQEETTNQIDGLGSFAPDEGFSSSPDHLASSMNSITMGHEAHAATDKPTKRSAFHLENFSNSYLRNGDNVSRSAHGYNHIENLVRKPDNLSHAKYYDENLKGVPIQENIYRESIASSPDIEHIKHQYCESELATFKTSCNNLMNNMAPRHFSQNDSLQVDKGSVDWHNENRHKITGLSASSDVFELNHHKNKNFNDISAASNKADEEYVCRKLCLNVTCTFFGSPELDNYCSQCYRGRCENLRFDPSSKK